MLKPVIKKLSSKVTQERIDNFFMSERFALPEKGNYQVWEKFIAFNIRALASAFLSRDSNVGVLGICLVFADTLPTLAIAPNFCLLGK